MNASGRQPWLGAAILTGVVYFVAGFGFAALAGSAGSHQMVITWRLAAWVASAAVYAAHIGYEFFRQRSSPRTTASHVSVAVAVGAFALAGAANVHAHWVAHSYRPAFTLALVVWPVVTAVPAFGVALAAAAGLAHMSKSA